MKKVLAILLLTEAVIGLLAGSAIYANFSDVAESSGNVFSAGTWVVCGELVDFIVPENVIQGQKANFTVVFHNCGNTTTYAVANVHVRRGETGENITLIQIIRIHKLNPGIERFASQVLFDILLLLSLSKIQP